MIETKCQKPYLQQIDFGCALVTVHMLLIEGQPWCFFVILKVLTALEPPFSLFIRKTFILSLFDKHFSFCFNVRVKLNNDSNFG